MDYSNASGIEYRVVKDAEYQGQPVRIVSGSRTYAAEVEELWDAVTSAERIPRWFSPITGELKLGGHYQLEGNASGDITRCEPPTALDITLVPSLALPDDAVRALASNVLTRLQTGFTRLFM